MRTRGRIYQEPRFSKSEREVALNCLACGGLLSEEEQPGANGKPASVIFCLNEQCGWREWTLKDLGSEVERLACEGRSVTEIAKRLGMSERTVFRRLSRRAAQPSDTPEPRAAGALPAESVAR